MDAEKIKDMKLTVIKDGKSIDLSTIRPIGYNIKSSENKDDNITINISGKLFDEIAEDFTVEYVCLFSKNNKEHSIKINNIPLKYIKCPDIVKEYCENIINSLDEEDFDNDKKIDFQKYLV